MLLFGRHDPQSRKLRIQVGSTTAQAYIFWLTRDSARFLPQLLDSMRGHAHALFLNRSAAPAVQPTRDGTGLTSESFGSKIAADAIASAAAPLRAKIDGLKVYATQ